MVTKGDGDVSNAMALQEHHGILHRRTSMNGNHRFRHVVCQWTQTCSQSSGHDHGFHKEIHSLSIPEAKTTLFIYSMELGIIRLLSHQQTIDLATVIQIAGTCSYYTSSLLELPDLPSFYHLFLNYIVIFLLP
ncbi:conserved domain protein [Heliomicrobium modesticaldum Ice1]|uniref:Conserved domain protein n=1 Tax=Heliobacterium modesticaldum (strain ATCC 51547 / Ice1) TaxID=498761 RepID=B0TIF3_HELMI|nr:conserved domain protein [Heliomicrobium modesticaldum Ice1]